MTHPITHNLLMSETPLKSAGNATRRKPSSVDHRAHGGEDFLRLDGLTKTYGASTVVDSVSLSVREGELVALLGPSGCGKTTTLRMIAGLIETDAGSIHVAGQRIDMLPTRLRGTTMVFQDYALFPHMTAHDNVAFGLRMAGVPKREIPSRVESALEFVQLGGIGSRYPAELSGGMQQRVALARAIVVEPRILLLDEPLSNLDAKLRKQMRVEIRELHQRLGVTSVFVTHDLEEAFYLADRVAVMNRGRLEQFAPPHEIYASPATQFVADFVGHTNLIRGELEAKTGGVSTFHGQGLLISMDSGAGRGGPGLYTIPPHRLRLSLSEEKPQADNVVGGAIHLSAFVGSTFNVIVQVGETQFQCDVPADGNVAQAELSPGRPVWLHWDSTAGQYVPDVN